MRNKKHSKYLKHCIIPKSKWHYHLHKWCSVSIFPILPMKFLIIRSLKPRWKQSPEMICVDWWTPALALSCNQETDNLHLILQKLTKQIDQLLYEAYHLKSCIPCPSSWFAVKKYNSAHSGAKVFLIVMFKALKIINKPKLHEGWNFKLPGNNGLQTIK